MQNPLADLPFFVEVARRKSFTRAADALDIPIATLSRRIAAMEKDLGIRLFRRTTRSVELTEEGDAYFKSCEFIVAEARNARENILNGQRNPTGRVRVAMPATVYFLYLRGSLHAFAETHPAIQLHMYLATRRVDLATEPFDLELRVGPLPDSSLKVRKLATIYPALYAAPKLLERCPLPRTPQDLESMPYIHLHTEQEYRLELTDGARTETVTLSRPRHVVNSPGISLEFILAGQAIGGLETSAAKQYEERGELVRLLPEWRTPGINVSLVMPPGSVPYRVRLFIDHLVKRFAELAKCE